jgi:NAD(P)H-hydrate repair Nnr-like enzyme with NAD(P)H-hydrate dehydratase domain
MRTFEKGELKKLYTPAWNSNNEDNGQVTIIGGSSLFHGAPILALKSASRIIDMVFFASSEPSVGRVAERIKSELMSFIWVPWGEVDAYIEKSDAALIGPGMMRFESEKQEAISNKQEATSEKMLKSNFSSKILSLISYRLLHPQGYDTAGKLTRDITKCLLLKYPRKKWVIDAGSLQTMEAEWIPPKAIITPNRKEFELLFSTRVEGQESRRVEVVQEKAKEHNCIIVAKGPETVVASPTDTVIVKGGNPGLTKGGSGDVLAGLTVALLAKNDPFLAACSASYIEKAAADEICKKVGTNYNMDDLADKIPEVIGRII